jgi:glyoxylase-like metal-dependent hydrolase (beta-lactamase superfamily II)
VPEPLINVLQGKLHDSRILGGDHLPKSIAVEKHWVLEDLIPSPKVHDTLPVILSPEEVLQFLESVEHLKPGTILTACYAYGYRKRPSSELVRVEVRSSLTIPDLCAVGYQKVELATTSFILSFENQELRLVKPFLKNGGWAAALGAFTFLGFLQVGHTQQNTGKDLEVLKVRPNFYVIFGAGGNIAVQTGPTGVVLVNTGAAEAAASALEVIKRITGQPIRYIINTSADANDVGGNAVLSKAGINILPPGPATILAAQQVLLRMSAPTGRKAAFPEDAWPTESFAEPRKDLYLNQEGIFIYREPAAHSDGDSIVLFRGSDVVVTGQIIDTDRFPVIDTAKGGSIQGEIEALNQVLDLSVRPFPFFYQGGGTTIVPGQGRLYDYIDLVDYRDMVVTVRDTVEDMMHRGMALAEIKAAHPAKAYEGRYGAPDDFVEVIYKGLTAPKQPKK